MTGLQLGADLAARAEAQRRRAEAEALTGAPDIMARFPLQPYIDELDHHGQPHRFWDFTPAARAQFREMSAAYPASAVEAYHRLLLAHLLCEADRRGGDVIPDSVRPMVLEAIDRILKAMDRPKLGYYQRENSLYRRDLATCRLKLLPCGSEVIDVNVRFDRRSVLAHRGRGAIDYLMGFRQELFGPLAPFYEGHWDRRLLRYFSAEQFDLYYRRVADLLVANPDVRGLLGGETWWLDPQLRDIAPEMMFLRDIPASGGARFIPTPHDNPVVLQDALAMSPKRRALYEAGAYKPKGYLMFWPRRQLIAWARKPSVTMTAAT